MSHYSQFTLDEASGDSIDMDINGKYPEVDMDNNESIHMDNDFHRIAIMRIYGVSLRAKRRFFKIRGNPLLDS
jgi:hypothetical protein